jgi:N,N'-diacetyllegionaminate synthase
MISVIAEVGSVHDGSFGNAQKLIEAASASGADIVKFQTHLAEAETLDSAPSPTYFRAEGRMEYFRRTGFNKEQWKALADHCGVHGIGFMSSPFSIEAVDLLEEIGVTTYKVPSGEVTNLPLLTRIAETRKPCFLSSGMSDWRELDSAVAALRPGGPLTVMQCTSAYPCPPERVGLNVISEMADRYGLPVGYSDHTLGLAASIAAVALGAAVVEKHFTFSTLMYGSDAKNSMEPDEFRKLVSALQEVAAMSATLVDKDDLSPFRDMKMIFQKSVVAARPIFEGHVLTSADLAYKKPGDGIGAEHYEDLIGRRARRAICADSKLAWEDIE